LDDSFWTEETSVGKKFKLAGYLFLMGGCVCVQLGKLNH
jgi:hypothetical protein